MKEDLERVIKILNDFDGQFSRLSEQAKTDYNRGFFSGKSQLCKEVANILNSINK